MRYWAGLIVGLAMWGVEDPTPTGIIRGTVIERDETESGGLSVRGADNRVFRLRFDGVTYAEREGRRISVSKLRPGDLVEVISDHGRTPGEKYARSVRVIEQEHVTPARRPRRHGSQEPARARSFDDLFPRGTLTFAGTVREVSQASVLLRRTGGAEIRILVRDDTRYVADGNPAAGSDLAVNTHVFIRAGKNLYGEIEAYQVVWGAIFTPR